MVECHLAKVKVASSNLVSRSKSKAVSSETAFLLFHLKSIGFLLTNDLEDLFAGKLAAEQVKRGTDSNIDASAGHLLQGADIVI